MRDRVVRIDPAQLFITPRMQARMKQLAQEHEVTYFPESAWQEDRFQGIRIERLEDGRLRIVESDNNLLKLIRWTHPLGLSIPKVPVWIPPNVQ
jgi:hypothetical protein